MDKKDALRIIDDYINRLIINKINIHSAYLFGSFAKENNHANSDIDLAIVINKIKNSFETEIKLMTLRKKHETIIEPHIFDKDSFKKVNPFINEIINTGIQIKIQNIEIKSV
ncbi:MAG: nucleotidyltransferase domain-containing protein [Bacteroidota bacterium]|nr:nucleotidyltransferase domain-containing protein [Bacteroidota bacterium]